MPFVSHIQILLIEDSQAFRESVSSMLRRRASFQVVGEAEDGLEGVQKAAKLKPDIVLLDIGLPKLNGFEACRLIRKSAAESKVIFLTQESDTEVVCAALETGALGYVHKSSVGNDLGLAIAAALNGKQFVSDRLKVPVFDIFAGLADKDAVYLETVAGLSSARERMEAIAAKEPGQYFVFSPRDHTILAKTETREKPDQVAKLKSQASKLKSDVA